MTQYEKELVECLNKVRILDKDGTDMTYEHGINQIYLKLCECKERNRTLFFCGNGGSAGIAQHMTADFLKNGRIRTIDMYSQPIMTCLSNDFGYDCVFSYQLENIAFEKDLMIAISSSGESENIHRAIRTIKELGGDVITFTGFSENNRIHKEGSINLYVPSYSYGIVESIHNLILQEIVDLIFEKNRMAYNYGLY